MGFQFWIIYFLGCFFLVYVLIINPSLKLRCDSMTYIPTIFFISVKGLFSFLVNLNFTLVEYNFVGGGSICALLRHMLRQ